MMQCIAYSREHADDGQGRAVVWLRIGGDWFYKHRDGRWWRKSTKKGRDYISDIGEFRRCTRAEALRLFDDMEAFYTSTGGVEIYDYLDEDVEKWMGTEVAYAPGTFNPR